MTQGMVISLEMMKFLVHFFFYLFFRFNIINKNVALFFLFIFYFSEKRKKEKIKEAKRCVKNEIKKKKKWVIAALNQINLFVKEQRVDGFSKSRNLDFVRCTLVAGKPVFRRTIHKNSYNLKFSKSIHTRADSFFLNPMFITGLIDAEGCFMLGLYKSNNYKMGYQIQAMFKITLHNKDYDLLCKVKDFFAVGSIRKHGKTTLQYTVKSLVDLKKIISHFDKYTLFGEKQNDYLLFKTAIKLIENKTHLNRKGFHEILSIKAAMNLGLSDELKTSFPEIIPISRPSSKISQEKSKKTNLDFN